MKVDKEGRREGKGGGGGAAVVSHLNSPIISVYTADHKSSKPARWRGV